jgi:hypothetical protein
MLFCVERCFSLPLVRKPMSALGWMALCSAALMLLVGGCDRHTRNLGGGFRLIHDNSKQSAATHLHHLYYESRDLGVVGQCAVSPSGCHALFEQDGKLILFHSCSDTLKPVANLAGVVPSQITWGEARNEARVSYSGTKAVTVVPLSACACTIESRPFRPRKETAKG